MQPLQFKHPSLRLLIALLVLVAGLMVALSRCNRPHAATAVFVKPGGDTLCVAIELSPVAHTVRSADGADGQGYYYDIIQAISRQQKRPVVVVPVTLGEGMRGLEQRRFDVLIADIPSTVAQKKRFLFTEPLNVDRQVLVQRRDSAGGLKYNSLFDLGGREVYVAHGSPFTTRIRHLADEIGDTIIIVEDPEYGQEALIMMAADGEIPNAIVNERQAMALAGNYPDLDFSIVVSLNQFQSWAVNKSDSAMLDTLNRYIRDFRASPDAVRLARAYNM